MSEAQKNGHQKILDYVYKKGVKVKKFLEVKNFRE